MQYITACVGHDAESLINVEKVTFVTEIEDSVVGALFNALIVRLKSWNLINRVVFCSSAKKFQKFDASLNFIKRLDKVLK